MDLEDIRRLATGGIGAFPPTALPTAAAWLWDYGEATGDARYCSLSRTIEMITAAFDANYEGLGNAILNEVDGVLATRMPDALGAELPSDGSTLARLMREAVCQALSG
jgi:hypothetical protein